MQTLSFIVAFGLIFAGGPSFTQEGRDSLPGAGTFNYGGPMDNATKVAHLTLTGRGRMAPAVMTDEARTAPGVVAKG